MTLTVVLVTQPARVDYFAESLECIAEALEKHLELELLVIFNGKSDSGEDKLKPIQDGFPTRVSSRIIEVNNPMPDSVFKIIREENLRWIHMPGDDDLVIPKAYSAFFDLMSEENSYVAVGFSAIAIDSNGTPSGKVLKPLDFNGERKERILAAALHKPLFVWPSLIFDATCVPEKLFSSRFVFDWWVGIQVLLSGPIKTLNQELIKYRLHSNQESSQVYEIRKRFEAELMLLSILQNPVTLNDDSEELSIELFLEHMAFHPPIYGDQFFGSSIFFSVLNSFSKRGVEVTREISDLMAEFAYSRGVGMSMSEFPHYSFINQYQPLKLNFNFSFDKSVCEDVINSLAPLRFSGNDPLFSVKCLHSLTSEDSKLKSYQIDCSEFNGEYRSDWIDGLCKFSSTALGIGDFAIGNLSWKETQVIKGLRFFVRLLRQVRNFF